MGGVIEIGCGPEENGVNMEVFRDLSCWRHGI
jgi:hypothetical protein